MENKENIKTTFRKMLSAPGLLETIRRSFERVPDPIEHRELTLVDTLMSGLAVFGMKYPSLLQFDVKRNDGPVRANLDSLYHIKKAPSDTAMREILDEVDPRVLRKSFKRVFALAQRGKVLERMEFLDHSYLFALDGTQFFSSHEVHCKQCCVKTHRDGSVTYYHQMLCGALIHPSIKEVLVFAPEPIIKQDGMTKNDCEINAVKRFLSDLKREHPHLRLTITEDSLFSTGPHIRLLNSDGYHWILGAKPGNHRFLFDWVNASSDVKHFTVTDANGVRHEFRYLNHAPLNDENFDVEVNFLEYWEHKPNGDVQHFSWITDFEITPDNVMILMRGGRARWKIENETFNTLKNQGYHFDHNFGHGYNNLSTVFAHLMLLAFLVDQVQQHCCELVRQAQASQYCRAEFWGKIRSYFVSYLIPDWKTLYQTIRDGIKLTVMTPNTG